MNRADRTNQAKVDATLGPGFKAGSAAANQALAKKFSQPAAAAAAPAPATNVAAPSADNEALKGQTIAKAMNPTPAADTRGAAAMASKSAPSATNAQTSDQIATAALNAQDSAPAKQNTAAPASAGGYAQSATAATNDPAPAPAQQNTAAPASAGGYAQSATAATNDPAPQASNQAVAGSSNLVTRTPDQIAADNSKPFGAQQNQATKSYASIGDFASAVGDKFKGMLGGNKSAPVASQTPVNNQSSGMTAQSQAQKSPEPVQAASTQAAKPAAGFSATGMSGTDFEESVEEDQDPADARRSMPGLQPGGTATSKQQEKLPSMYDVERANKKEIKKQFTDKNYENPHNKDTTAIGPGSKVVNTIDDFEESIDHELAEMLRLSGLPIMEKAASKQQQKFMGMVHAMQKGEKVKGASAELKAAAKDMSKKDAKDFASTKHKGLPKKVNEGVVLEAGSTLEHIVNKFKHETKKFINGEDLDTDLYEALFDYYSDNGEIPYGVAKARDGDPFTWIENRFEDELSMMGYPRTHDELNFRGDRDLTELALLAGLSEASGNPYKGVPSEKGTQMGTKPTAPSLTTKPPMSKEPGSKPSKGIDTTVKPAEGNPPEPQEKKSPFDRSADELTECGDMSMDAEDKLNISTNMSSDGTRSVNISAQGDQADALLQMLKMAGMRPHDDHAHSMMSEPEIIVLGSNNDMMEQELEEAKKRKTRYSNTPDEEYQSVKSITTQGNDLNREKRQYASKPRLGDNPMAESTLDADLDAMLESILIREREGTPLDIVKAEEPYKDPKTGKMVTPIKGATNPPPDSEFPPGDPRNSMPPKPARKK